MINLKRLTPTIFFTAFLLLFNYNINAQCTAPCFWVEDFETNGTGTRYTADFQFSDGLDDYFGRVDHNGGAPVLNDVCAGVSIHVVAGFGAPNGDFYMAGEDVDDPSTPDCGANNGNDEKNIVFDNINIDGSSDITVRFLLSVGSGQFCTTTAAAWDTDDFIRVFYEKDAGGEQQAYCFRNNTVCGNSNNQPFTSDPNCDGNTVDGMIVPNSFTEFSFTIDNTVTTASDLDLRFNIHSDATNEEFAIDYIRLEATTPPTTTVPIELADFNAYNKNEEVMVEWTTISETNNDYFVVEHSLNGERFQPLGEIEGAGSSEEAISYTFMHTKPAAGLNFYRLKQVDFDETSTTSEIKSVNFKSTDNENNISIAPNPFVDELGVRLTNALQEDTEFKVYDLMGKIAFSGLIQAGQLTHYVNLSTLEAGIYVIQIEHETAALSERIIKL